MESILNTEESPEQSTVIIKGDSHVSEPTLTKEREILT